MLHFSRWKIIATLLTCLAGVLFTLPNFFSKETVQSWPSVGAAPAAQSRPRPRGGAHLLLSMETEDVRKDWLETLRDDARNRLRNVKIVTSGLGIANRAVQVRLAKPEDADAAHEGAARHGAADRQRPDRHQHQRYRHPEGRRRRHHHNADRARPAAAHQQCGRRRHRDRAPPRRRAWARPRPTSSGRAPAASSCRCRACRIPPS